MACRENLKRLMAPRHIAFVGGSAMAAAAKRCRAGGFKGQVWLVNPTRKEIDGEICYPSVRDLPEAPDASFIATSREITVDIVTDLSVLGAGGAVCYASGFAEMDEQGAELQEALVKAAGSMAIIGPNCYGLLDYLHGAALWPVAHGGKLVEQGVAIITQSGNFAYNLSMTDRSLPVSYMVSVGNQASVTVADIIEALLDEPRVTAIGLHLEGLKDVGAFARAATRALKQGVPIVVLKSGTSSIGAELALSHTSSLAGSDELYNTLFERVGSIRVSGPVGFIETLKIVASGNLPQGSKIAALACSGGDAGLIADYCESNGLDLPQPTEEQHQTLTEVLPIFANVANPLDFTTAIWGDRDALSRCVSGMLDGDFDYGFLILDYPGEETGERGECDLMAEVFGETLAQRGVPGAVASVFPELLPASGREKLQALGVPALQGIEDALQAIGQVVDYSRRRQQLLADSVALDAALARSEPLSEEPRTLDEWESKQRLGRYGLPIPSATLATPENVGEAAEALGFPVVVKVASAQLPHKTEAGAVKLNLQSAQEVQSAVDDMVQRLMKSHPHVDTGRILVERMSPSPVAELIVGIKSEAGFGIALVIGAGGVLVELVNDSASLLLPTSEAEVRRALESLKIHKLLQGFRGKPGGDVDATVNAIMAIAHYATEHADTIAELDVNPLMVHEQGVVAVDALIREGGSQ
jgi:acyl-CoA synthetase (NDP forming)